MSNTKKHSKRLGKVRKKMGKVTHNIAGTKKHLQNSKFKINPKIIAISSAVGLVVLIGVIIVAVINRPSYEEYDLKGLTIKEACEKARGAGWEVDRVVSIEGYDKTDCYNTGLTVSDYYYYSYNHSAVIYFGEKKTEEQKKAECEASGKWYRDGYCKSQEEWENEYQWRAAHSACKKYGQEAYAKTLTECYLHGEYVGGINGSSSNKPQSNSSSDSSWKQVLNEYEAWMNEYVDFMIKYRNTTNTSELAAMLSDYSRLMSEMTEWAEKLENLKDDISSSDVTEYIQTMNRINQRLNEIN